MIQSCTLAIRRDTLLPKLLGEALGVSAVLAATEEALA